MVLLLALVLMVSKFVLGINFSILENGYLAFGYHEIRGEHIWALSFDSFSGSVSTEARFPEKGKQKLTVQAGPAGANMKLDLKTESRSESYDLTGDTLELFFNDDEDRFTMTLSGNEVYTGFFSAVWQ